MYKDMTSSVVFCHLFFAWYKCNAGKKSNNWKSSL